MAAGRSPEIAGAEKWMVPMHEEEDVVLNVKAIGLAVGGAALAALLFILSRRDQEETPVARAEAKVEDLAKDAKRAAKAAKKKQKELAKETERDLKAAAWDAQQQAQEAESRLRAAGSRVVDDASHLASRVGAEAKSLAGGGRERLAQLRHREEDHSPEREIARLRAEIDELRQQLGVGKRSERDFFGLTSRFAKKGGPFSEVMASQAAAAALAQLERSFKAKAPALLAAKNRAQVVDILQQELGPTLRDAAVQAAAAAFGLVESAREEGVDPADVRKRTRDAIEELREAARKSANDAQEAARRASDDALQTAESVRSNGKHRFWRSHDVQEATEEIRENVAETAADIKAEADAAEEERHGSKAGLLWGGAGLGLAIYALMDAERRERMLRLANEASIQVQELVRDLQGYDDEF